MKMDKAVTEYIASAPAEQQPTLTRIRKMIRKALPHTTEQMGPNGFAVYTLDGEWIAGFATRKKCAMFYVMAGGALDKHADKLGKLRSGKSCVDFKASKQMSMDELWELAERILADTAISVG